MLRGSNWARWLALAWIAFHVFLSFLHSWQQVLVHCLFFRGDWLCSPPSRSEGLL